MQNGTSVKSVGREGCLLTGSRAVQGEVKTSPSICPLFNASILFQHPNHIHTTVLYGVKQQENIISEADSFWAGKLSVHC